MTHDDVRNELAAAERKVRAMAKVYELACSSVADDHGCAQLRSKLAQSIVDEAFHKAKGMTPDELLACARKLVEDDALRVLNEHLDAERPTLTSADRRAIFDAAKSFHADGINACAMRMCTLLAKWQDEQRLRIWRAAETAIADIGRMRAAFETMSLEVH